MAKFIFEKYQANIWWADSDRTQDSGSLVGSISGDFRRLQRITIGPPISIEVLSNLTRDPPPPATGYYPPQSYLRWQYSGFVTSGFTYTQVPYAPSHDFVVGNIVLKITNAGKSFLYGKVINKQYILERWEYQVRWSEEWKVQTSSTLSMLYKFASKSTKLQNLTGTDLQYPLNGLHTDNYWYVRTNTLAETTTPVQPSGGETIDSNFNVTWTRTANDTNTDIELSFDNGATWKRIASNVEGTSLSYDFTSEQETSLGRIRTRAVKGSAVGEWTINSGVFTIKHNYAPLAPTQLSPNSIIVSKADVVNLNWKHNHSNPASKFELRWSVNQTTWNTVTRNTPNEYYNAPEDIFPAGTIYWQVKTFSDIGIESPWSNVATFIAAIPSDNPVIISSGNIAIARPTFQWSQADQSSYQIQILNSVNAVVWDSGEVVSSNKARTSGIDLLDNSIYTLKVRTKTSLGLWTYYTEQPLIVSYTPPAIPIVELIENDFNIVLNIDNPTPTGTEPTVLYNDIYRDGIRIATNILASYVDNNIGGNRDYNYQVVAIGDNASISQSLFHSGSIKIKSSVISDMKGNYLELVTNPERTENNNYQGEKLHFAGRRLPVMQFEEFEDNNLDLSFILYEEGDLQKFKDIIARKQTILYRDNRGRKIFGTIRNYSVNDNIADENWYGISFTVEEIDYSEVV